MDPDETKRTQVTERRPYEPPRVEETATFEHLVLACGHTATTIPGCGKKPGGGTARS